MWNLATPSCLVFALVGLACMAVSATPARAEIKTLAVDYGDGETKLRGHLYWDDAAKGKRPAVLVFHEWWGLNDYARNRARMLAELGYVAFAADMYGEGKITEHPKEAGEWAGKVRTSAPAWRQRALAAFEALKKQDKVDTSKIAAIGYCFGGSTSLQLAYTGADIKAVATFHGALPTPTADEAKAIKAKILICHGSLDAMMPEDALAAYRKTLEEAKVDYQFIYYAGAYHGFSNPDAAKYGMDRLRHNPAADARSWAQMKTLLEEAFK